MSSDLSSGGYPPAFATADTHGLPRSPQIMSRSATNGNLSSGEYPQSKSAGHTTGRPSRPRKRVRASTMREVEKLSREMKTSDNPLKIGTRTYRSKEYDNCFSGCELVDWILAERSLSRLYARRLACSMVEHSIICRAEPSLYHTFKDSTALFMFQASHGVVSVRIDEVKDFLPPDPLSSPAGASSSVARKRAPKIRIEFRDQIVSCDPFATQADDVSASKKSPISHHRTESTSSNSSLSQAGSSATAAPTSPPVLSPQNSLSSLPSSSQPSSPTNGGSSARGSASPGGSDRTRSSRSRTMSSPIGTAFFFAVKGQRDSITIRTMNSRNGDGILRIPSSEFNKGLQWFQFTPRASKTNPTESSAGSSGIMPRINLELFYTPRLGNGSGDNSVSEYILECAQQHRQKGTPHSSNTFTKGQYASASFVAGRGEFASSSLTLPGTGHGASIASAVASIRRVAARSDDSGSSSRSSSRSGRKERAKSEARRQKTSKRSSSKRASDGKKNRGLERTTSIARRIHRRTGSADEHGKTGGVLRAASINFRRRRRGSTTIASPSASFDDHGSDLLGALRIGRNDPTSNGKGGGGTHLETFDALKLRSRSVTMPRGKRKNRRKSAENAEEAHNSPAAGHTSPSLSSKSVGGRDADELSLDDMLNDPALYAHKQRARRNSDGRNRRSSAFVGPGTIGITKGGRAAALRAMFNASSPRGDDQKHRSLGRTRRSQGRTDDLLSFDMSVRNRRRMGIPDLPPELREDINSLRAGPEFPTTPRGGLGSGSFFRLPARRRGKSVMARRRSLSNGGNEEQFLKEESLSQDVEEHSEAMQTFVEQHSRRKPLGFLRQKSFGTRETLGYTSSPISSPLLVLKNGSNLAVKNFVRVQEFMNSATPYEQRIQLADQVVDLGLRKEDLRDEILFQIYKQTTGNPSIAHTILGFKLFAICLTRFQPSDELQEILWQFFQDKCAEEYTDETEELVFMSGVCDWILTTWHNERKAPVEEISLDHLDDFCEALYSPARFAYNSSVSFQILAAKKHGGLVDDILPILPVLCQSVLDLDGKNVKGIFRVSSSRTDANRCRKELEDTQNLSEVKFPNAATAADLLKVWLRYLSIPLIPYQYHDRCFDLSEGTPQEAFDFVKESISPDAFRIMAFLMRFFADLSQHSDVTSMGVSNIAIVIAPNILRSRNDQASIAAAMEKTPLLLKFIEKVIIAFRDGIADKAEQSKPAEKESEGGEASAKQNGVAHGDGDAKECDDDVSVSESQSESVSAEPSLSTSSLPDDDT